MEQKKLQESELVELQGLKNEMDQIVLSLGELEKQNIELQLKKTQITAQFEKLIARQNQVLFRLEEIYGIGYIDLENGLFTPQS